MPYNQSLHNVIWEQTLIDLTAFDLNLLILSDNKTIVAITGVVIVGNMYPQLPLESQTSEAVAKSGGLVSPVSSAYKPID